MGWANNTNANSSPISSSATATQDDSSNNKLHIMEELSLDIQNFASMKKTLQEYTRAMGTSRDNEKLRLRLKQLKNKASTTEQRISKHLTKRLDSARALNDVKRKQLQKLNEQFLTVREEYSKALRECTLQEKKHSGARGSSLSPTSGGRSSLASPSSKYGNESTDRNDSSDDDDSDDDDDESSVMSVMMQQQLQLKKKEKQKQQKESLKSQGVLSASDSATLDVHKVIAMETNRELESLEADFLELHECFQDMNTLIKEQGESINIIYDNVSRAREDVEIGVEDIKAADDMNLNKGLRSGVSKLFGFGRFF